ncbi:MAG: hypothetical protein J7M12_03525, partial [Candidatus Hydrogenedentes bacterium]|nr:hypothetical protein [Candidatus Hydrogenedentota bacterium]
MTIVCGLFLAVSALGIWWTGRLAGRSFDRKTLGSFTAMYTQYVDTEESTLRALSATIVDSGILPELWWEKKPSVIRDRVNPLLRRLRTEKGITHFRLYGTDRRVFMDMSGREPDDSVIGRISLVRAAMTGQVQSGIEIDERGELAIHVVTPVIENDQLVCLLDLGIDLQSVLADVSSRTGVDYMLSADRTHIPGYNENSLPLTETDRYVLTGSSMKRVPPRTVLNPDDNDKGSGRLRYIHSGRQRYAVRVIPVVDFDDQRIGSIAILSASSGFAGEHGTRSVIMFTFVLTSLAAGYVFVQIVANRLDIEVNHELDRIDDRARQKETDLQKELNKVKKLNFQLQTSRNEIAGTAELLEKKVRRAEKKIDESVAWTDFIESALRATGTRLAIMNGQYDLRYVDPTTRTIYGDPNHRKCYEYFMQQRSPCTECGMAASVETGTITISEQTMPKEDGLPVQLMTAAFSDEKGEVLFAESRVDISARREMERAFQEKETALRAALKESRDMLAAILDATTDGILAVNTAGEITHSSASFRKLWQIPSELVKTRDSQKVLDHILS